MYVCGGMNVCGMSRPIGTRMHEEEMMLEDSWDVLENKGAQGVSVGRCLHARVRASIWCLESGLGT